MCLLKMFLRAVGLTVTGGWVADRLFEAGLEDVVVVAGRSMPTLELGGWVALGMWCTVSVAAAAWSLGAPSGVQAVISKVRCLKRRGQQLFSFKSAQFSLLYVYLPDMAPRVSSVRLPVCSA